MYLLGESLSGANNQTSTNGTPNGNHGNMPGLKGPMKVNIMLLITITLSDKIIFLVDVGGQAFWVFLNGHLADSAGMKTGKREKRTKGKKEDKKKIRNTRSRDPEA